ncbi:MAG: macro domain-containing protein [Clostridiales bacterium]|nr:macro domain-containing protein [Clostridiales bacterium]
MPFEIIRNDITKVLADAIVNPTNPQLVGDGGVDGAIHLAAGPELSKECHRLGRCEIGQAKITKGYNLLAKYIIHTVGPIWQGGKNNEEQLLADCYKNILKLAKDYKLESIAFPLISSGTFGYPKDRALSIAISEISKFLLNNEMMIYLVVFDKRAYKLSEKLFSSITQYIDDKYTEEHLSENRSGYERTYQIEERRLKAYRLVYENEYETVAKKRQRSLDDVLENMDETFSQMLLRLIDESGMSDAETYKKANIDRKLFSKIRNDKNYKPSKPTVLAFAIALRLNLDETKDLLLRAGFALSYSSKFDIIIQYFIENANYDIFEINEALFAFDQNLLGV